MLSKSIFYVLAASLWILITTVPCRAEAEKVDKAEKGEGTLSGEVSLSALSAYIWRGQELSRHSLVLQPSFTLNYGGLSANLWGNWDSDPHGEGGERWNETDVSLFYGGKYRLLNYEIGYMSYNAVGGEDSQEVSLKLGIDVPLSPSLTVYREVMNDLYWYFLLTLSHSFPVSERLAIDLSASAGYLVSTDSEEYPEVGEDGGVTGGKFNNFHDGILTVSFPYKILDNVYVTPALSYTFPLCGDARREMKYFSMTGRDSNFLYGGAIVTYSF